MMNQSNEKPRNLSGKIAVITGAASGIGLATTKVFLDQGAAVFGIDIAPEVSPGHTQANDASRFQFHRCDLTAPGAPDEAVVACQRSFGGNIDILVNAAGIVDGWASADTVTDDEWKRVMSINVEVPVKLMRAVLPAMKQQKSGAIVNICSKASSSGASAGVAYTASKHALAGVTKNVAWRFRDEGIRCNAVSPGGRSFPGRPLVVTDIPQPQSPTLQLP